MFIISKVINHHLLFSWQSFSREKFSFFYLKNNARTVIKARD
ncbi:hypothetical protein PSM_B0627 [Pseudoalteromonas sp. SM9913]|nr:hypothetical protein PSM_B0627 [Pseudoalteromonas sp. SM9913]